MRRSRPIAIAALLTAATLLVAACGGSAATPASVPAPPAPTAEAVATPEPTAEPTTKSTAEPTPPPYAFASSAYGYRMTLPGVSVAKQALQPWDGESRIDWVGAYTDQVLLAGDVRFFVYGSPTDLDLAAYATIIQEQSATWHDCPAQPSDVTDLAVGEVIGQLARMRCTGDAYVQKLVLVSDGEGLVVNLLAEPAVDTGEADALFEELVAAMTWPA